MSIKKILFGAIALALAAFVGTQAWAEQVAKIVDGTLVISDTTEVARVPDVPKGLTAEKALELVTKGGEFVSSSDLLLRGVRLTPHLWGVGVTFERVTSVVSYRNNGWHTEMRSSMQMNEGPADTVLFLGLPLFIFGVFVYYSNTHWSTARCLLFPAIGCIAGIWYSTDDMTLIAVGLANITGGMCVGLLPYMKKGSLENGDGGAIGAFIGGVILGMFCSHPLSILVSRGAYYDVAQLCLVYVATLFIIRVIKPIKAQSKAVL